MTEKIDLDAVRGEAAADILNELTAMFGSMDHINEHVDDQFFVHFSAVKRFRQLVAKKYKLGIKEEK